MKHELVLQSQEFLLELFIQVESRMVVDNVCIDFSSEEYKNYKMMKGEGKECC